MIGTMKKIEEGLKSVCSMKYFFDTEFIDDGKTIELISIGIVSEDGRKYYAISNCFNEDKACDWVKENVIKSLEGSRNHLLTINREIREFVGSDPSPTFWAYYGAYDWVIMCQLFGRMLDLPNGWPHYYMDVKQLAVSMKTEVLGGPQLPPQKTLKHNALNDAEWTKECYEFLEDGGGILMNKLTNKDIGYWKKLVIAGQTLREGDIMRLLRELSDALHENARLRQVIGQSLARLKGHGAMLEAIAILEQTSKTNEQRLERELPAFKKAVEKFTRECTPEQAKNIVGKILNENSKS